MNPALLQYLDTGLILAILGGIAHILITVGNLQTKIDTMWEWWKKEMGK